MTIIKTLGAAAVGGAIASLMGGRARRGSASPNTPSAPDPGERAWPATNVWFVVLEEPGKRPRVVAGFDDYVNGEDGNVLSMDRAKELRQEDGDIWAFTTTREGVRARGYDWGSP